MNPVELCPLLRKALPCLFDCIEWQDGQIRVRTPFMYPDGDMIDVFILDIGGNIQITDYGVTLDWLRIQSTNLRRSARQELLIRDACQTLDVTLDRGQLTLDYVKECEVGEAVIRLSQACMRVADAWFLEHSRVARDLSSDVFIWLGKQGLRVKRSTPFRGLSGREWNVDYCVASKQKTSLVFLLSVQSRGSSHGAIHRVHTGCSDLDRMPPAQRNWSLVSLFDDTVDVWKSEDYALLAQVSTVASWSRRDEFKSILSLPDARIAAQSPFTN